ncbi:MAG TPA: hypothetical protein VJ916_00960 [Anaerovoracaceae bacterium]|nr:hypothetical protein [Anaerovoracaceae bacterium]
MDRPILWSTSTLFRGDLTGLIIMLILDFLSVGIAWFIWPFIYNRRHINRFLEKDYRPMSSHDRNAVAAKNYII